MNIEQQKKLYETGNHICLMKHEQSGVFNRCSERQMFQPQWIYQLIHKKHEHILDAFLDGCEIYIYTTDDSYVKMSETGMDFIETYEYIEGGENWYLAIPKSLENCYCEANQLHHSKLDFKHLAKAPEAAYYDLRLSVHVGWAWTKTLEGVQSTVKIEYNTQLQNWVYCPKETTMKYEGTICRGSWSLGNNCKTCEKCIDTKPKETIVKENINNFKEYGFTAPFPGKIEWIDDENVLVGYVIQHGKKLNQQWDKHGVSMYQNNSELTPIVPELVYPMFKKSKDGSIFKITAEDSMMCMLGKEVSNIDMLFEPNSFSIDVWTDVPYDSERGLYHGQPVFFKCQGGSRTIDIWNTSKQCTAAFGRDTDVEPIPLEALKYMDFIWEQYQTFIKEK